MSHQASRIESGDYHYRGFRVTDHGADGSLHSKMQRASGRWVIRRDMADDVALPVIPVAFNRAPSLKEAKATIDRAYMRTLQKAAS